MAGVCGSRLDRSSLAVEHTGRFEPPYLAFSLNVIFTCTSSLIVTVMCGRSFMHTGSWPVIWLGTGALVYGLTMLVSGFMVSLTSSNANAAVTVHNIGALFAGMKFALSCHSEPAAKISRLCL